MLFHITLTIVCFSLAKSQFNDTVIRQSRPLSIYSFDEILIDGAFDIFLSQALNATNIPTVEIETNVDSQRHIIVEIVDNHILSIHINGSVITETNIYAYIRFRSPLRRYTIKGTGNTITDDNGISNENTETFLLDNRGVANLAIRVNVHKFDVYFTGTGNSRFWGEVRQEALFDAKGVGDINALGLVTKFVKVRSIGVSIIRVAATEDVQIEVSGVSNVYYRLPPGKNATKILSNGLGKILSIS